MHIEDIPLERILIRERTRTEIRNIDSLADSIRERGLLQPIVVRRDGGQLVLVAGGRRIAATRKLGKVRIEAHVAETLNDELDALLAEGEENTEREPFTPSEAVAHAERIEAIERNRAEARRMEAGLKASARAAEARRAPADERQNSLFVAPAVPSVNFTEGTRSEPPREPKDRAAGESRNRVAKAVGLSAPTLAKAKHVVETARDPEAPQAVREEARAALAQMDRTRKVEPAYRKVRDTQAALADAPLDDLLAQDVAIKHAKLRAAITGAVIQLRNSLPKLSAEHCSEAMEAEQWEDILRAQEILGDWIEQVRALRKPTGLRLVK